MLRCRKMDCCFKGRPLAQRLRNLCVVALALDSIFLLVNVLIALNTAGPTQQSRCLEFHGYPWHGIVVLTFVISAVVAAIGAFVHASVACDPNAKGQKLILVARFAHALLAWIFLACALQAVAYQSKPAECALRYAEGSGGGFGDAVAEESNLAWETMSLVLTISWVAFVVSAGTAARRGLTHPLELEPPLEEQPAQGAVQPVGLPVPGVPMCPPEGPAAAAWVAGRPLEGPPMPEKAAPPSGP